MATEKEEIILDIKIDGNSILSDIEKIEAALLSNREAQAELNKAYKAGIITQQEYVKESVRIQQNSKQETEQKKTLTKLIDAQSNSINALTERNKALKKERNNLDLTTTQGIKRLNELNVAIDKNDKAIQKNVSSFEKQKINIGNYASALDVVVPGTNRLVGAVTGLSSSLSGTVSAITKTGFSLQTLNAIPIVAFVTALVGAFELLKFAMEESQKAALKSFNTFQDQQKVIEQLVKDTNNFIDALRVQNELLALRGNTELEILENERAANALLAVTQTEKINLLKEEILILKQRETISNADIANQALLNLQRTKRGQEEIEKEKSLQKLINESGKTEKQFLADKLLELDAEEKSLIALRNQLTVLSAKSAKQQEINDKEAAARNAAAAFNRREAGAPTDLLLNDAGQVGTASASEEITDGIVEASNARNAQFLKDVVVVQETEAQKRRAYEQTAEYRALVEAQQLQTAQNVARIGMALLNEQTAAYKLFASASTIISTYSAATKAYESAFLPVPTVASPALGAASAALAIAQGLANLAAINGVEFAEGGYTGPGSKSQVAGVVHKDEYVVPKHIVQNPMYAGHIGALETARLRPYADGGLVTTSAVAETNQAMITANVLKNLPPGEISAVEMTRVQKRIDVKERISRLSNKKK